MRDFVLVIVAIALCSAEKLENPCQGRKDGFARDLKNCQQYYSCNDEGMPSLGICEPDFVFDAEKEICISGVNAESVCFKCPNRVYALKSVPHACMQYIECFNGNPTLNVCSGDLVFDGRPGLHQCNFRPPYDECYREDDQSIEENVCPPINGAPVFMRDPNDRYAYYVCYGQEYPQRATCANGLEFDTLAGSCSYPKKKINDSKRTNTDIEN